MRLRSVDKIVHACPFRIPSKPEYAQEAVRELEQHAQDELRWQRQIAYARARGEFAVQPEDLMDQRPVQDHQQYADLQFPDRQIGHPQHLTITGRSRRGRSFAPA